MTPYPPCPPQVSRRPPAMSRRSQRLVTSRLYAEDEDGSSSLLGGPQLPFKESTARFGATAGPRGGGWRRGGGVRLLAALGPMAGGREGGKRCESRAGKPQRCKRKRGRGLPTFRAFAKRRLRRAEHPPSPAALVAVAPLCAADRLVLVPPPPPLPPPRQDGGEEEIKRHQAAVARPQHSDVLLQRVFGERVLPGGQPGAGRAG